MAVEQWLRDLELAPRTKVHIRNTMHVLFECAARWELIKENPITGVRQGADHLADLRASSQRAEASSECNGRRAVVVRWLESSDGDCIK